MLIINEKTIAQLNLDAHTNYLANSYMDSLDEITITKARFSNDYIIEGIFNKKRYETNCQIVIDFNQNLQNAYCDCYWYSNRRNCAHTGALAKWLAYIDIPKIPAKIQRGDSFFNQVEHLHYQAARKAQVRSYMRETDRMVSDFQQKYSNNIKSILQDNEYTISMQFSWDYDDWVVDFKVGNGKKFYVIKNYIDFLNRIDHGQYYSYGKMLAFIHRKDAFDETSQKVIDFMKQAKRYESEYSSNARYITLDPRNLTLFYSIFKDIELENIHFEEAEKTGIKITVNQEDDYYYTTMNDEFMIYVSGRYIFENDQDDPSFRVVDLGSDTIVCDILNQLRKDTFISREQFPNFRKYLLNVIQPYVNIVYNFDEEVQPKAVIESTAVYGDIVDDKIVAFEVRGKDQDGNKYPILNNDEIEDNYTLDIIREFFEQKADFIENHTAYFYLDRENIVEVLNGGMEVLLSYCDIFLSETLKKFGRKTKYNVSVGVRVNNNLLQVNVNSDDFDMKELGNILSAYRKKKKFYRCKDGKILSLNSDELEELDSLMNDYGIRNSEIRNGKIELEGYRTLALDKRLQNSENLLVERSRSLETYVNNFYSGTPVPMDSHYDSILRDYQKYGVQWLLTLYKYGLNGILADEMGLGKTVQVLALLDSIRSSDRHSIVICPASLIYNWQDETEHFSNTLKCQCIVGAKDARKAAIASISQYDVSITSYDYMRRDADLYEGIQFEYIILDEAQNIKNQRTMNAETVKTLKGNHRLALSGTPIENSLAELWSIFDFLMPNYLFNYHYFRSHYEKPITVDNNDKASANLRAMVSPFILRRTKKEVLTELPDKVDHKYLLDFTEDEKNLYMANLAVVNKEMRKQMDNANFDKIAVLAMLTRLRQLCCDGRLVYENIHTPSTKVKACVNLVKLMNEHHKKTLIFSSFTSLIDLLIEEFEKEKIPYYVLTGQTSKEERRQLVSDFNDNDIPVFLISLKAGGTGLNLTAAENVIHIDPWWNVSAQNQATDRAHRIGQNANVQVYRMIMKDSIEERILQMQERKQALAESFIEGADGTLSKMSKEEIMDLLSI